MKKIIFLAALFLGTVSQAQVINVYDENGQINNGDIITFTTLGFEAAKLPLSVENVSNASVNLKLRMDLVENAANIPNTDLQFCFGGQCFFEAPVGTTVPSITTGLTLAPGAVNEQGDHFANAYAGDNPALPVVYTMSFVQVDNTGAVIGQPLLTFTYKYQARAGVDSFTSL